MQNCFNALAYTVKRICADI